MQIVLYTRTKSYLKNQILSFPYGYTIRPHHPDCLGDQGENPGVKPAIENWASVTFCPPSISLHFFFIGHFLLGLCNPGHTCLSYYLNQVFSNLALLPFWIRHVGVCPVYCRCLATSLALTPCNPPLLHSMLWRPIKSSEMAKILWRVGKEEKFTPAWKSQIQILLQIILPQYFFDNSFQAPKALQVYFRPGLAPLASQVDNSLFARTLELLALKSVLSLTSLYASKSHY